MKPGTATLFFLLSITAAANGQLYMYFVNALQDLMKNPAFLKEVAAKQSVAQPAAQPADSDVALDGGMIWKASKDVEKLIKVTGFNIFPPSSSASPSSSSSLSSSSSHSTSSSAAPTSSSSSISASSAISPAQEIKPMPPRTSLDIGAEPQANENQLESIQLQPQAILPHQFQLNPMQQQQQPNPLLQQQQPNPLLQQQQPNPLLQQQQPNPLLQQQPNPLQEEPQPNPQPTINIPEGMSARDYLKTVPHLKYHSGEEANFNLRRRYFARQRRV